MRLVVALGLTATCLAANAQVACTMPNGRTITLSLTHTCPTGATAASSLDGQAVQIASPPSTNADGARPVAPKGPPPTSPQQGLTPAATQSDGSRLVNRASSAGCSNKETYEQLTKIAVQGDSDAFTRALAGSIVTGQCVLFKRGDAVFVDETALFSGLVRLRPKGQARAYWTAIETISTK